MALSATAATHGAPNENASVKSATVATTQDARVSRVAVGVGECIAAAPANIGRAQMGAAPRRGKDYTAGARAVKMRSAWGRASVLKFRRRPQSFDLTRGQGRAIGVRVVVLAGYVAVSFFTRLQSRNR